MKKILIYEDDVDILDVCRLILKREKYHVETLEKCDNIIDDIKRLEPDIVLVDLWLPQIGGENAMKLMKECDATKYIPAILFSASDTIEEACLRSGGDGFLKKPFDIPEFLDIIKVNLEKGVLKIHDS